MTHNRRWGFGWRFGIFALIVIMAAILLNRVVAGLGAGRFDLTEDKIYSVSSVSREIMRELKVPVKVNLYITGADKMPSQWKTLEQDVVDKLREFEVASNGMLTFAVYDPSTDPELAKKLEEKQVFPFPVQSVTQDEFALKNVYSAIGISYLDKEEEVLPRVVPQTLGNMEYELISRVYRLTLEKPPHVALYAPLESVDPQIAQMLAQMGRPVPPTRDDYNLLEEILGGEKYQVTRTEITQRSPIPEEATTLVIVDPRELNERQLYEIGRRIAGGANAVIAAQKRSFAYQPARRAAAANELALEVTANDAELKINDILDDYGVTIDDEILMDESHGILSIQSEATLGGFLRVPVNTPVELPIQIQVRQEDMNEDLSITGQLSSVLYLWGSPLGVDQTRLKENGLTSSVLMTSSSKSWLVPARSGAFSGADFQPPAQYADKQPLAMLLEGQFPDPFKDKPRPEWLKEQPSPTNPMPEPDMPDTPAAPLQPKPARVLVTGCARMWSNNGVQVGSNALFFLNAVDGLTLGDRLIFIRSKVATERSVKEVSSAMIAVSKFLVTFLIPILLIAFGIARFLWRRRDAERYLRGLEPAAS